jgi:hypothetical protein
MSKLLQLADLPPEIFDGVVQYFAPVDLARAAQVCHEWFFYFTPRDPTSDHHRELLEAARIGNFKFVDKHVGSGRKYPDQLLGQILCSAVKTRRIEIIESISCKISQPSTWSAAAATLITAQDWLTVAKILAKNRSHNTPYMIFMCEAIKLGNRDFVDQLPSDITSYHFIKNHLFINDFVSAKKYLSDQDIRYANPCWCLDILAVIFSTRLDELANSPAKMTELLELMVCALKPDKHSDSEIIKLASRVYEQLFNSPFAREFLELFSAKLTITNGYPPEMILAACQTRCVEVIEFLRDRQTFPRPDIARALSEWLLKSSDSLRDYKFLHEQGIDFDRGYFIRLAAGYQKHDATVCQIIVDSEKGHDENKGGESQFSYLQSALIHGPLSRHTILSKIWSLRPDLAADIWRIIINGVMVGHCVHALRLGISQPPDLEQWAERACLMNKHRGLRPDLHQILKFIREDRVYREKMGGEKN